MKDVQEFDVIVIGGGPAGSTTSTLIAMNGHKVLLLEKEKFPRYQIGESLLPATVHGICVMLGIEEEIKNAGFQRKSGGTFQWGKNKDPWTFNFDSAEGVPGYAYQVERMKFDNILLQNAKRKGVHVQEECSVEDVLNENGRVSGVRYRDVNGTEIIAKAKYIVDSSGNTTRFSNKVGERIYSEFFRNVALFAYYENGKRLPAPRQGNIFCSAFGEGWFWYIPLSDTLTSVGAVISQKEAAKIKNGEEEAMKSFIDSCPLIKEYLSEATRVTEGPYGKFRIRKDWSYANSKFWSPGMVLVGDAACFVDPVFSSGVHLATYSGLLAARSINTALAGEINEERCFNEYERQYRREYNHFYQFLISFYEMHRDEESYFWAAQKVINTEERNNEAFVRLVAGSTTAEEFFSSPFHARLADDMETTARLQDERHDHKRNSEFSGFYKGLAQARNELRGVVGVGKIPLFEGGLISSDNWLTWQEP